jgi:hypothetical protein
MLFERKACILAHISGDGFAGPCALAATTAAGRESTANQAECRGRPARLGGGRSSGESKETPPCHSLAADGAPGLLTGGLGGLGGVRRDRESNVGYGPIVPPVDVVV